MSLSCTVFEISRDIGQKSPIRTYPTSIWHPHWGDPGDPIVILLRCLASEKLESLGYPGLASCGKNRSPNLLLKPCQLAPMPYIYLIIISATTSLIIDRLTI